MPITVVHDDSQFHPELVAAGNKLVVVDFTATWCGPCKMIAPVFEQLSNQFSASAVFLKVDVDQCADTAASQGVSAMPTFIFYKSTKEIDKIQGANARELEAKIRQHAVPVVEAFTGSGQTLGAPSDMWFNGGIADAISLAKRGNKLFMVFIEDDTELSKQTSETIESVKRNISSRAVAIRIKAGTDNAKHFSAIYPVPVTPATYLISGNDGVPVEVIVGDVNATVFKEKFDKAEDLDKQRRAEASKPKTVTPPSKPIPEGASRSRSATDEDDSPRNAEASSPMDSSEGTEAPAPLEDRMDIARRKVEELQRKKAKAEEEAERQRELERREVGKAMLHRKKQKDDSEMRELAMQRNKEKREDEAARQRVLDQIKQDREDRKAKFERSQGATVPTASTSTAKSSVAPAPVAVDCNSARIQFKLPDGRTITKVFEADANLLEARNYLVQEEGLRRFALSTVYPRRSFADEDYSSSFRTLELLPSSVLLVLTTSTASAVASSSSAVGLWSFFATLVLPLTALWAYIQGMLGLGGRPPSNSASGSSSSASSSGPGPNTRKRPAGPRTNLEREGNVSRLRTIHDKDDDDENNTWNGNSTQQM